MIHIHGAKNEVWRRLNAHCTRMAVGKGIPGADQGSADLSPMCSWYLLDVVVMVMIIHFITVYENSCLPFVVVIKCTCVSTTPYGNMVNSRAETFQVRTTSRNSNVLRIFKSPVVGVVFIPYWELFCSHKPLRLGVCVCTGCACSDKILINFTSIFSMKVRV